MMAVKPDEQELRLSESGGEASAGRRKDKSADPCNQRGNDSGYLTGLPEDSLSIDLDTTSLDDSSENNINESLEDQLLPSSEDQNDEKCVDDEATRQDKQSFFSPDLKDDDVLEYGDSLKVDEECAHDNCDVNEEISSEVILQIYRLYLLILLMITILNPETADLCKETQQQTPPHSTGVKCSAEHLDEILRGIQSSCFQESNDEENEWQQTATEKDVISIKKKKKKMTSSNLPEYISLPVGRTTGAVPFYDDVRYGIQEEPATQLQRGGGGGAMPFYDDVRYGIQEEQTTQPQGGGEGVPYGIQEEVEVPPDLDGGGGVICIEQEDDPGASELCLT